MKLLEVQWYDSFSASKESLEQIASKDNYIINSTVGYLIAENPRYLFLSHTYGNGEFSYMAILKKTIMRRKVIER